MSIDLVKKEKRCLRMTLVSGFIALFLLIGVFGGWAATARIEGAVVAAGTIVQEGKNKPVQHDETGIVKKLQVTEGQLVQKGDLLVILDGTRIRAEQQILSKRLFELKVRKKRMSATRDGKKKFFLDKKLVHQAKEQAELQVLVDVQKKLFRIIQSRQRNREKQLNEQIGYLQKQIRNINGQIASEKREAKILKNEVRGLGSLKRKRLVNQKRYNQIRRERTQNDGALSSLGATIAKIRGQVADARLKIIESREKLRADTLRELEKTEAEVAELDEKLISASYRLGRLQITSPHTGFIHELQVRSSGSVIRAGDVIMQIVPKSTHLVIEARISPRDIDQVNIGAKATVRFSAFNQRTTPILHATIIFISPDHTVDERSREVYFTARLIIDEGEAEHLKGLQIVPGMPAEVMIKTSERTVISFLTKPLNDQINRAFRED